MSSSPENEKRIISSSAKSKSTEELASVDRVIVRNEGSTPARLERHLEFLDFDSRGCLILGCSNLTGRHWVGSLWYYDEAEKAPAVDAAVAGVECDNGVVDGFFIKEGEKRMLVALDNGSIEHVSLHQNEGDDDAPSYNCLERTAYAQEHDDIITGLARAADNVVTCSYDKSIVVMDINTFALVARFEMAHSDLIFGVSSNPLNPNVLATAGSDGVVATWDLRSKAVISGDVYDNASDWPTAVEWSPQDENILLVGGQSGQIGIYDVRNKNTPVAVDKSIDKQIHRFKFSPFTPDTFAVSADTFPVRIFEISDLSFKITYEDELHHDFVRGMAWHPLTQKLWTCGWDHLICTHDVSTSS